MNNSKHTKPDFVLNFRKPKSTEIKHINGHWNFYEITNYYDKATGRSRTKSGAMLGKITADGSVPKNVCIEKAVLGNDVVEMVMTRFLYECTAAMRFRLKEYFPDIWEKFMSRHF